MKILVVRFSSLGDIVLTLPALECLSAMPKAKIDYLTKPAYASLLLRDPRVRKVFTLDPNRSWRSLAAELRAEAYDRVVDLHANPRSYGFSSILGRPISRLRKAGLARRMRIWTGLKSPSLQRYTIDRYLDTVRDAPHPDTVRIPDLRLSNEEIEEGRQILQTYSGQPPNIALHPLARHATKQWPAERFIRLADGLAEKGARVFWFGAPNETEALARFTDGMRKRSVVLAASNDLRRLGSILSHMNLVISNDSGPMHLACSAGAPTLGIFGSTHRDLGFFPLGKRATVSEVEGLACRPCHPHGRESCPKGHFKCMTDLEPEIVLKTATNMLGL